MDIGWTIGHEGTVQVISMGCVVTCGAMIGVVVCTVWLAGDMVEPGADAIPIAKLTLLLTKFGGSTPVLVIATFVVAVEAVVVVDGAINMDEGNKSEVVSAGNATPPSPTKKENCVIDCEAPVGRLVSA